MSLCAGGFNQVTESQVKNCSLVVPEDASSRHCPTAFADQVEGLESALIGKGLMEHVNDKNYFLSHDSGSMYCEYLFNESTPHWEAKDGQYSLIMRASNMRKFRKQIFMGKSLFVCTNGMYNADFTWGAKQTSQIGRMGIDAWMMGGVSHWLESISQFQQFEKKLREMPISNERGIAMIALSAMDSSFKDGEVPILTGKSHSNNVLEHWLAPKYKEFEGRTAYSLYNSFNEVWKKYSPDKTMSAGMNIINFMEKYNKVEDFDSLYNPRFQPEQIEIEVTA